ncbi:hypothetical protein HYY70_02675 [Candidatus Woesearchaeota archaeon]|nr:hypothetical protein [Candidatus Woesearchaeota archaeon]
MKKAINKLAINSIIIGSVVAFIVFLVFGTVTVLIKNPFFIRMTHVHWYDYIFLILTALLTGVYACLYHYNKSNKESFDKKCNYTAAGGIVGGLFSFGCAICNKLLVFLLGLSGVMVYFMPLQPILGVISIAILSYAVYIQLRNMDISRSKIKMTL